MTFFWFYFLQEINDFSTRAVEACLRFMYSGELKVKLGNLVEVAAFADKYAIAELKGLVNCRKTTTRTKIWTKIWTSHAWRVTTTTMV